MPASDVEIVNQALVHLGQPPIQSLDQTTPAAVAAKAIYQATLEECLRAHPWNFATGRVTLDPLEEPPAFGWSYQFSRPADWLRTLETSATSWRHEGKTILCNEGTLEIRYIRRVSDPTEFDALFGAALARLLSAKLAYPLTKSTSLMEAQWQMYAAVLQQARSVDAQEEPADDFEESSLLRARSS